MFSPTIFGATLRMLRQQRGMSQGALVARSRVSRSYLSRIESGQNAPSLATLEKLAAGMGVSVGNLLDPDGYSASLLLDPFIAQVACFVKKLSGEQMDLLVRTLSRLKAA